MCLRWLGWVGGESNCISCCDLWKLCRKKMVEAEKSVSSSILPFFCAGVGIRLPLSPLGIPRGTFLLCAKTIDVSVNTISLLAPCRESSLERMPEFFFVAHHDSFSPSSLSSPSTRKIPAQNGKWAASPSRSFICAEGGGGGRTFVCYFAASEMTGPSSLSVGWE